MKVLWICNGPIHKYYTIKGNAGNGASWIDGLAQMFSQRSDIEVVVCFPTWTGEETVKEGNFTFYAYRYVKNYYSDHAKQLVIQKYHDIIKAEKPDIVHLWGTEFPYVLYGVDAAKQAGLLETTVIQLQGMCSAIASHYYAQIPDHQIRHQTFRDFIKADSLKRRKNSFERRALYEKEAIQKVRYVIGRTDYDHAYAYWSNPDVTYFHCNEILRDSFYTARWEFDKCEKYSIFFSQAYYPLKGLHFLLKALALVKEQYPAVKLKIAGSDIFRMDQGVIARIKDSSYSRYIKRLIREYDLVQHIEILGTLGELEMRSQYLKSHLFVSASATENESNSLSEAKMLGMPIIASYVGGVANRVVNGCDALVYQYDDVKILAYYIQYLFQNPEKAVELGENAHKAAALTNDRTVNSETMIQVYKDILK